MCNKIYWPILLITINTVLTVPVMGSADQKAYEEITKHIKQRNITKAKTLCKTFLRTYTKSNYIADVRFILAEYEPNPATAIRRYNTLVTKYRYYKKRDIAQLKICEIHYLLSDWKKLLTSSYYGHKTFSRSSISYSFDLYYIIANIKLMRYQTAQQACNRLIEKNHNYHTLSRSLLLLVYINKKTSGYSRTYIYNLRELAVGFKNSQNMHATLFLLGDFYEKRKDHNKAWSAYSDLVKKYPHSIEARHAQPRLKALKRHNPQRTDYLPGKKTIASTDTIDIAPEIILEDTESIASTYYSVVVGPFRSLQQAKKIKRIVKNYGVTEIVKYRTVFNLYIGKYSSPDEAFTVKVRLAEEHIINGRIARVAGDNNKKYIYGEE